MGRAQYDAYGNVISNTIPLTLTAYLYTGQRLDTDTGLYDYRARFFDPLTSGFTQPDSYLGGAAGMNRYGYVGGNPVNYTDPSGHFACGGVCIAAAGFTGAAFIGGSLNAGIGKGAAYLSGQEYTWGDAGADFFVGAAFGALGYGVGASFASPILRIPLYGILSVGEGMSTASLKGDSFTTNDMAWAFIGGVGFGAFGELVGVGTRLSAKKGWGIANSEYMKVMESIGDRTHDRWMRSNHVRRTMKQIRLFGGTPTNKRFLKTASNYPIRPIYKADAKNLSNFARTTIWMIGTFVGDSEPIGLFKNYLPELVPN